MMSEADLILIEQFLNDELEHEQIEEVRKRISEDLDFALKVELVKGMAVAIRSDTDAFRSDLSKMLHREAGSGPDDKKPGQVKRINLWIKILTAAAIVTGVILATNIFLSDNHSDLYGQYFTIPPENITTRMNTDISRDLQQALKAYSEKDYKAAIPLFQNQLSRQPEDPSSQFFLAISQMAVDEFDAAIKNLNQLISRPGLYQNSARWYLALSYLRSGREEEGISTLEKLLDPENVYTSKARDLLNRLH